MYQVCLIVQSTAYNSSLLVNRSNDYSRNIRPSQITRERPSNCRRHEIPATVRPYLTRSPFQHQLPPATSSHHILNHLSTHFRQHRRRRAVPPSLLRLSHLSISYRKLLQIVSRHQSLSPLATHRRFSARCRLLRLSLLAQQA